MARKKRKRRMLARRMEYLNSVQTSVPSKAPAKATTALSTMNTPYPTGSKPYAQNLSTVVDSTGAQRLAHSHHGVADYDNHHSASPNDCF